MGIIALATDVGKVAEAIKKITDILKALNRKRSVVVEVQNLTTTKLKLVSQYHDEGGFAELPSSEILPGQVDVFGSQDEGVFPGATGHVVYESEDGFLIHVDWENSAGIVDDTIDCNATIVSSNPNIPLNFHVKHICGSGSPAHMRFIVEPGFTPGLILRKDSFIGEPALDIATIRSGPQEFVTAIKTGSGGMKLMSWEVGNDGSISQRGSAGQAGEASSIDISRGRLIVTACRTADGDLKLISWEVAPDGTVLRRGDSADKAGEAGNINLTALSETLFVTAVSTAAGNLKLITWELADDDTFNRLGDSADDAGEVKEISLVKISSDGAGNHRVVTSVRAGNGDLVLITWRVSTDGRTIKRLSFNHGQAGEVSMIRSVVTSSGLLVTSVRSGSGDLVLITWSVAGSGNIVRLADSHGQAGTINSNALMSRSDGVLSAVNGGSGLKLIAWRITPQGAIERTSNSEEQAGEASVIALCQEPLIGEAPIVTAVSHVRTAGKTVVPGPLTLISWADQ